MATKSKRTTVYFDPALHRALRVKAAETDQSLSDLVNTAVRENLSEEPRLRGCEVLSGKDRFRLRQGDFRILFEVDDGAQTMTVVKIGHRRDVYR